MKVFVKDPEIYLTELGVSVPGMIDKGAPAKLGAAFRSGVNREIYFFTSLENKKEFDAHPERYCGLVTDPVDGSRIRPRGNDRRIDYMGRPYFFSSDSTLSAFEAAPDSFTADKGRMVPKGEGG